MLRASTITENDPVLSRALGIAVIYQRPALLPDLTVAENIALGLERRGAARIVRWARASKARERIAEPGWRVDRSRRARSHAVDAGAAIGRNRAGVGRRCANSDSGRADRVAQRSGSRAAAGRHPRVAAAGRGNHLHFASLGGAVPSGRSSDRAARRRIGRHAADQRGRSPRADSHDGRSRNHGDFSQANRAAGRRGAAVARCRLQAIGRARRQL